MTSLCKGNYSPHLYVPETILKTILPKSITEREGLHIFGYADYLRTCIQANSVAPFIREFSPEFYRDIRTSIKTNNTVELMSSAVRNPTQLWRLHLNTLGVLLEAQDRVKFFV